MHFPDYVFNEIHTYVLFSRIGYFTDTPFLWQRQTLMNMSLLSFQKKIFFASQLSVKFVKKMFSTQSIALVNWFACLLACTSTLVRISLTSLHLKGKFNKAISVFIMRTTIHEASWSSISHWRNYSNIHYKIL